MNSINSNNESQNENIQLNSIINNKIDKNNLIRIKKKKTVSNKNFNDNRFKKNSQICGLSCEIRIICELPQVSRYSLEKGPC